MGDWDVLCILCAIRPGGGPRNLLHSGEVEEIASQMLKDLVAKHHHDMAEESLEAILKDALQTLSHEDLQESAAWLPVEYCDWGNNGSPLAIGDFTDDGLSERHPFPTGEKVEVWRVTNYSGSGCWDDVIVESDDGSEKVVRGRYTTCTPYTGNLVIHTCCWNYLCTWLDLPPRTAFLGSMSLEGELFEIINSQPKKRRYDGTLPAIKYGPTLRTCEQWQDFFCKAYRDAKHTAVALSQGLRGMDLVPALMQDFRCHLFIRPDIWPSKPAADEHEQPNSSHTLSTPSSQSTSVNEQHHFLTLPIEILLSMLQLVPVPAVLALSSSCKSLYSYIGDPAFLNQVFKESLSRGSLMWLKPVHSLKGERERAFEALRTWLPSTNDSNCFDDAESVFASAEFPYLAFIPACCSSDSMRNRRRIWNNVKQFEKLWTMYRTFGWEWDVFTAGSEHVRYRFTL